jgi:hypothetical protein
MVFASSRQVQCETVCNQRDFGKRTKNLSELSDPENLDGSPTNSKTRNQAIKARESRLTRKQSVSPVESPILLSDKSVGADTNQSP